MNYEKVPFGNIFSFHNGKAIKASDVGKYPVYGSNGVIGYTNSYLYSNAIILGRVGAYCGSVMYCQDLFWASDNTLVVDVDETVDDIEFCYYMLQTLKLNNYAGGSAQPLIPQTILRKLFCPRPDVEQQRRIAYYLSAYDSLIENNQKQIKLLEEAAQRLYKEWFIDLRFPGYESTPIVDGVPEGWEKYPFSEKVSIMSGGTPKTDVKEYYGGDIPFYSPKDHDGSFFAYKTETSITNNGLINCNSALFPINTIIITARGTVGKTVILAVPMAMNQSCYALKCSSLNLPYYLFFSLCSEVEKLKAMSNGGVFDTIIVKTFDNIQITIPTNELAERFETMVSPFMEQIKIKMQETSLLSEARDRLLPKLMSGEIITG